MGKDLLAIAFARDCCNQDRGVASSRTKLTVIIYLFLRQKQLYDIFSDSIFLIHVESIL